MEKPDLSDLPTLRERVLRSQCALVELEHLEVLFKRYGAPDPGYLLTRKKEHAEQALQKARERLQEARLKAAQEPPVTASSGAEGEEPLSATGGTLEALQELLQARADHLTDLAEQLALSQERLRLWTEWKKHMVREKEHQTARLGEYEPWLADLQKLKLDWELHLARQRPAADDHPCGDSPRDPT